MITKKTWEEFRSTGLLLIINQILHIFGWAICFQFDEQDKTKLEVFPARVKFRGFSEKVVSSAYIKISEYLKENSEILLNEAKG
jgi:hypothetical protein